MTYRHLVTCPSVRGRKAKRSSRPLAWHGKQQRVRHEIMGLAQRWPESIIGALHCRVPLISRSSLTNAVDTASSVVL